MTHGGGSLAACACLAVHAGSLAVVGLVVSPNWYANGYNFNAAYIAQYNKLPVEDIAWCADESGRAVETQVQIGGLPGCERLLRPCPAATLGAVLQA